MSGFGGPGLPDRLWREPDSAENGVGRKAPGLPGKVCSGLGLFSSGPDHGLGLLSGRQASDCALCSGSGAQE